MIRQFTFGDETGLVPIADRMLYLGFARLILVATVLAYWWTVPGERTMTPSTLSGIVGGYLLLALLGRAAWRLGRRVAVYSFGLTLLADGLFLTVVASSPDEPLTPLRYLVLLHVITVTLLASFRTGLKIAVWHTLLLWLDLQVHGGEPATTAGLGGSTPRVIVFCLAVWAATYCTAIFAAVNERELRRRNYDMAALAALAFRLEQANAPAEVAHLLLDSIGEDFGLGRAAVVHRTGDGSRILGLRGVPDLPLAVDPADDELLVSLQRDRRTLLVTKSDPRHDPWLSAAFPNARNLVLVPMNADDQMIGVLCLEYGARRNSRIERRVVGMLERFGSYAALALANAVLLETISRQAATDGLTGAANRRTFDERLAHAITCAAHDGDRLSLLLLDVDHFKRVNDTHGHGVGDDVLRHLVRVASAGCRPGDVVARYGGEEFALILPGADAAEATGIAERVRTDLIASDSPVPVTISIGIATLLADATDADGLVAAADAALYRAKAGGRNRSVRAGDADAVPADRLAPVTS